MLPQRSGQLGGEASPAPLESSHSPNKPGPVLLTVLAHTGSSTWSALSPFSIWLCPVTFKDHLKSQLPFKAFP